MKSLTLRSPAKLNLYLQVTRKRSDGFHSLITLFEKIDLCDRIRFTLNSSGQIKIVCDHPDVPVGPKNLVHQAAVLLKKKCHVQQGATIHISKNIPVAAGLAGGSTNAATALKGLDLLWNLVFL